MVEQAEHRWGRVAPDGTVYVRTADGERPVGQWPDADPAEAMAFFAKRYDGLELEVDLLEKRIHGGKLGPEDAAGSVRKVRRLVTDAQAVGDLDGLLARLDALDDVIAQHREERRAERARQVEEARAAKEKIAEEAERLATGHDWRGGASRLRDLLEQWKSLPRLEKSADDALWRRFSTARTTYTRRRKQHFAEQNERRDAARVAKERLVEEAEALADSREWGPTAGRFRDLMQQWKAAGPTHKEVDDALWARFRGAQDRFFAARDAANADLDKEYAAHQSAKEALLLEAEGLLPVTDVRAARDAFRDIARRWDAVGKVPRTAVKDLESRIRRVEQAIKSAEEDRWRRSNPEARARAADTVGKLESSLAELQAQREKAAAVGDDRRRREAEQAIEARQAWLAQVRRALDDFSPPA
ncbi:MAG: DUF349 domain-containing protein [Actinomycetota bacterium]|nr:DUF349 domain-containing protein [Actinomycetota bacterium]